MTRAVVDTNVVVSGILNRAGVPAAVLRAAGLRYELVWTQAIAVECRRILDLPRIQKRLKGREAQARHVLVKLATITTMVPAEPLGEVRAVKDDADGDVLFATALVAGARTIVSGDAAVLAVGSFAWRGVVGGAGGASPGRSSWRHGRSSTFAFVTGHGGPHEAEAATMKRVKVWDLFVRFFHWGLALVVLGSFLTSERDAWVHVHARLGLTVLALVVARLAWGFIGSPHARFSAFVKGPREVLAYLREMLRGRPSQHLSHNPMGGAMVVALLAVLLGLVVTGALAYSGPEFGGALAGVLTKRTAHAIKEVHEALSGGLIALLVAHVAGVLVSSYLERQNLVKGMVTGWKLDPAGRTDAATHDPALGQAPAPARSVAPVRVRALPARMFTALLVGVAVTVGLGLLLGVPTRARAASPLATELLREYQAAARRETPSFQAFQAAEGRRIYEATHVQDGAPVSCATCHTADPRRPGVTPAGKAVDPLAPSANPLRFTDRADVEKWFKRNCKQVLGRECTATEKGHFLTYLLSL